VLPDSIIIYSLLKYITVNSTTWTYNNFLNYFMKKYTFRLNKLAFFFTLLNYYNNLEILYVSDSYYINKIKLYYNIDIFNRNSITINKYIINTHKYNIINFF
jgi:hypothetical protein